MKYYVSSSSYYFAITILRVTLNGVKLLYNVPVT